MIIAKIKLPLKVQRATVPAQVPTPTPIVATNELSPRYNKLAMFFVFFAIVLLVSVIAVKSRQYWNRHEFDHRMQAFAPACMTTSFLGQEMYSSGIGVNLAIINNGPDSVPFNWNLKAVLPTGNTFNGQVLDWSKLQKIPNVPNFTFFSHSNDLIATLGNNPIKHNQQVYGALLFYIQGLPTASIPLGTKFFVSFQDGQGHVVTAYTAWNGPIGQPPISPP